jgi:hypothetical protein
VAAPANLAGQALQFKTLQSYSNGQVVHSGDYYSEPAVWLT